MIVLVCGKLCAGKTTYAKQLMQSLPAVRLNPDEVMKTLFGEHMGPSFDEMFSRTMKLLFQKALEIDQCGLNVVLDAGFWYRHTREEARAFFAGRNVEWHYVHVSDEVWRRHIAQRNQRALEPGSTDYYVDENLLRKFQNTHDEPTPDEIDVWVEAE